MNMEAPEPVSMIQEIRTGGVGFEYALFRFGEEAKLAQVPRIYLADLSRMSSATLTLSVAPDSSDPHAQIVFIASVLDDRGARLPMLAKAEEGKLSADQTGFLCVDCGNETLKAKSLLLSLPLAARHLEGYFVNLAATGQAKVRADLESSITGAVKEKEESREPGKELMPFIGPVDSGTIDNSKVKLLHFNRTTRTTEIPLIFHDDVVPGTAKFDVRIAVQDKVTDNINTKILFAAYDKVGNILPLRDAEIEGAIPIGSNGCCYCDVDVTSRRFISVRANLPRGCAQVRCHVVNLNPRRRISVKAKMRYLETPAPIWRELRGDDGIADHWSAALYTASCPAVAIEVAAAQSLAIKYLRGQLERVDETASPSLKVGREALLKGVTRTYHKFGTRQALARIYIHARNRNDQGAAIEELAKQLEVRDREAATCLYRLSYDLVRTPVKARNIAAKMFKNGNISEASRLLTLISDDRSSKLIARLRLAHALRSGPNIPRRHVKNEQFQLHAAYVAAGTLPFLTTGYAIRTHQLVKALGQAGVSTVCYVRPGFPHDRPDAIKVEECAVGEVATDGVRYSYSSVQPVVDDPESYIERVSDALENHFRVTKPAIVHAASNYMNALPALIAARRVGVPFIYEVRGLWALTAASRLPGWEGTERFKLDRQMEMLVAREADHVLAITRGVADELTEGGLPAANVTLLPNAVDPELFRPVPRDEELARELGIERAFTLVYAGSLTVYEGLDDLINAVSLLRQQNVDARLIVVGTGVVRDSLEKQVSELDLEASVTFVGRVSPDDVGRYLSLADAVALPRKAFKVCKVVSPLKPFEAMAMGKPVVLTDLPALREIVEDEVTGLIAAPENPDDLARVLLKLADDPGLRARLGEAARRWVIEERSWSANAELLKQLYAEQSMRLRNAA